MPHRSLVVLPPLPESAEHLTIGVNLLASCTPRCIEVALVGPLGKFLGRLEFPEALGLEAIDAAGRAALDALLLALYHAQVRAG